MLSCGVHPLAAKQTLRAREDIVSAQVDPLTAGQVKQVTTTQDVHIVDIRIPFGSMVILMVKWAIAAIPAAIILTILAGIVFALFRGLIRA
jgi:hypothetical protein